MIFKAFLCGLFLKFFFWFKLKKMQVLNYHLKAIKSIIFKTTLYTFLFKITLLKKQPKNSFKISLFLIFKNFIFFSNQNLQISLQSFYKRKLIKLAYSLKKFFTLKKFQNVNHSNSKFTSRKRVQFLWKSCWCESFFKQINSNKFFQRTIFWIALIGSIMCGIGLVEGFLDSRGLYFMTDASISIVVSLLLLYGQISASPNFYIPAFFKCVSLYLGKRIRSNFTLVESVNFLVNPNFKMIKCIGWGKHLVFFLYLFCIF